ncbi:MAG: ATP-binding protein [Steroidobacteraceae bacterium]
MFNNSLSTRLLITVSLLLAVFFGITTVALDKLFRDSSRQAISGRLDIQTLVLMAAAEERDNTLAVATALLDSRYLGPNSGLYGQISTTAGDVFWRSPSLLGAKLDFITGLKPAERQFGERSMSNGTRVLSLSVALDWQFADGHTQSVVYSVAESMEQYYQQLQSFRVRLFGGFAVMSVLLIVAMAVLFRSVLQPLRRIEVEIEGIEAGELTELGTGYPSELIGVTENMNALLRSERERMGRYRDTLGNLAHSLKTPLAVIRNLLSTAEFSNLDSARQMDEQVVRMDQIVSYQLKRAAASVGMSLGTAPVLLNEVVGPVINSLQKVYFDRHIACDTEVSDGCAFLGDKGDLMELVGNLLDNAFKYCQQRVRVVVSPLLIPGSRRDGIMIVVEDDGVGIAPEKRQQALARGTRLDERPIGQGIGLSVVRELVELYRGSVVIDDSTLGGARITVRLLGA